MFGSEPAPDGRNLIILLPQYKQTCPPTLFSLLALFDRRTMRLSLEWQDAYIVHTRNRLAGTFMQSPCEWGLFVDDDMILPCGNDVWFNSATKFGLPPARAGLNTIERLVSRGVSLVGGLYTTRDGTQKLLFGGSPGADVAAVAKGKDLGVLKTDWVATGCMLVHRSVFESIQKTFPHLGPRNGDPLWQYFSPSEDEVAGPLAVAESALSAGDVGAAQVALAGVKLGLQGHSLATGEDVAFCKRALAAGHQPHVDTGLVCGHVGAFVFGPGHPPIPAKK